ncbi:hypothetical protein [Streptacidiphilus sp. PAMC 29251]
MALSDISVPRLLIRTPVRMMVVSAGITALAAAALTASVLFFGHLGPSGAAAAGTRLAAAPTLPPVFRLFAAVAAIGGLAHLGGRLARRAGQRRWWARSPPASCSARPCWAGSCPR